MGNGANAIIEIGSVMSTVQTEILAVLGDVLPVAGTVFAALAGISIGFKFFKRITGARS